MQLNKPVNANYCATVVRVSKINKLKGCDNVVGVPFFGFQAITSKDTKVGDLGVVFPVETQLSQQYSHFNNLYRHADLNEDKGKKGYLDDNCRIRAQKFRGHTSNALFMPLESLSTFGVDIADFKEGDEFDELNGVSVCNKYVVYTPEMKAQAKAIRKDSRVDSIHLPEHFATDNFYKVSGQLSNDEQVIVTQKLHGTSVRIAHTYVSRKLTLVERVAKFFGAKVVEQEHDYVFGSRKVIKDANNPDQVHYYDHDIWSQEGKNYVGIIPENFIVYAEIVGKLSNGQPIQQDYNYGMNNAKVYVYRVCTINSKGQTVDLTWDQVKAFCDLNGMLTVPELWRGTLGEFKLKRNLKKFIDKRLADKFEQALPVSEGLVDEGVCVRVEGTRLTPYIMKAKSPLFFEHETAMLDARATDIEAEASTN